MTILSDYFPDPIQNRGQFLGATLRAQGEHERLGEQGEASDIGAQGRAHQAIRQILAKCERQSTVHWNETSERVHDYSFEHTSANASFAYTVVRGRVGISYIELPLL